MKVSIIKRIYQFFKSVYSNKPLSDISDRSDKKLHLSVSCSVCGGQDIHHEQKEGRGLPPKGWVRKVGDSRKISWKGIWDIWTCKNCGEIWKKLR